MSVLAKAIYRLNTILIKTPMAFLIELEKKFLSHESQKTQNSQNHPEQINIKINLKKNQAGGITMPS